MLGVAYQRHGLPRRPPAGLAPVSLALLAVAAGLHIHDRYATDMARYQRQPPERVLAEMDWLAGGWRTLPAHRLDLEGEREQALDLQHAGPLGRLERALAATGWRGPPAWSLSSALAWLTPTTPLIRLPLLPQVHDGCHQSLLMIRPLAADSDALAVLRLWTADARTASGVPLWLGLGSVTRLRLPVVLGLGRLPRPGGSLSAEETIGVPPLYLKGRS